VRVIAVFADGPKQGWQFTVLGHSVFEVFVIPDPWIPPPLNLGPPMPWEPFRRVTYWYVRSVPAGYGIARWRHVYALDPADEDMTWQARRPPPPAWTLPDGSGQKVPWWRLGSRDAAR
jgi:hypothetical protein